MSERIRSTAYWSTTVVVLFELLAGGAWNLTRIDWVDAQLVHLHYPPYFAYVLGVAHLAAAVVIGLPGLGLLKEWAYAGIFLLWSGAAVSHLAVGDTLLSWGPPLMFLAFGVASWALRPAGRRPGPAPSTSRAWAGSVGLLVALTVVSFLSLPAADDFTSDWPKQRGWVTEQ
ncbi:DoxX family protein [Saccharothrix sp. NPDC042600]|uniref:DoxX family protein n=1 Tax=Saccharothrix TaxID=2071 RepID=UPI0033DB6031|nr:DoxX family protein [Saccharothrix mutabilis subsp. capreolus]